MRNRRKDKLKVNDADKLPFNEENKQSNAVKSIILEDKSTHFGRVIMEVNGLNFARVLTSLSRISNLNKVRVSKGKMTFSAPAKDLVKIIALLNKLCYNFRIVRRTGAISALRSLLSRWGIVFGLFSAVCILALYPCFVIKIESEDILSTEAKAILSEYGVFEGNFLLSLDEDGVQNALLDLDGVSFASVTKRGTRVYVAVAYELAKENFVKLGSVAVTAKREAEITRLIVFDGTPLVAVGDRVQSGQTLIDGYLTVGEELVPSSASGEVFGKTEYSLTRFFPDSVVETVRGERKSYTRLSFFNSETSFPSSPYDECETLYKTCNNNLLLPFEVKTVTYTRLTAVERANNLTEEEMKKETETALVTTLPAGARPLYGNVQANRTDGGYLVTATASVEERIDNV